MAERRRLTDAAIARLRPREREYTVWDSRMPGLGVRVRPQGGKSFVFLTDGRDRVARVSLGPVSLKGIDEVRRECHALNADPKPPGTVAQHRRAPLFREFVEGEWKRAHFDGYKASSQRGAGYVMAAKILPAFGSRPLDRITPHQVRRWFEDYSKAAPGGANRSLALLRQILNFAVACGHIDGNPTQGIRPNRRSLPDRFLSRDEITRLHRVLDAQTGNANRQQADIIRLLLLTGCRKAEIVRLRWSEVQNDMIALTDSKTGPRNVPLNAPAIAVLRHQPRCGSAFVFPSPLDPSRPRNDDLPLWSRVRREANIEDVRLHDLRHTHASYAVMNGVPIPVVSRLLGHSNVSNTLRYAHLGDKEIEDAAELVGQSLSAIMGLQDSGDPP